MKTRRYVPSVAIVAAASLAFSAVSASPPATLLRYRFKPSTSLTYTFSEETTSTVKIGDRPNIVEYKQTAAGTIKKIVKSTEADQSVVDESIVKGIQERVDGRGTTTQLMPTDVRRYTFTSLGKLVKLDHLPVNGDTVAAGPQPLDGLTFSLPEKAVTEMTAWTESLTVVGLNLKPMTVAATSTYRGASLQRSHETDQIEVSFSGTFLGPGAPADSSAGGSLTGRVTYYLARDLGMEVVVSSDFTIEIKGTGFVDAKSRPFTRTIHVTSSKALMK